ncbi:MAG TPA: HD domain-containing phosphohydrolase [Actinomycetota bacterium]|nr:HD domain-containing phosphohydrolase [Actinomycetota bacterium]
MTASDLQDPHAGGAAVLLVDDEESFRAMLGRLLERAGYSCSAAADAPQARDALRHRSFDLVLADVDMPGTSGLDLAREIRTDYPDTAVVMVTGIDDTRVARAALELGAYGYVVKPFEANEILVEVASALRRRALEIENRAHRERLELMVRERTGELWSAIGKLEVAGKELRLAQEDTVERLSIAAEFRDDETARHVQRMSRYSALLASRSGEDAERAELVRIASVMHDVGKIGIPDSILLKPGKLTPEERRIMEQHSEIGYRILSGSRSEVLSLAATIAWTHHERVDGTGYPRKLAGDAIPLEGRIAAIADVFDALTSHKVYKKAFPLGQAVDIMREGRGSHFDADLLDLFLDAIDEVIRIKERFADR